jgi:RNA recognition motif-containing protein
MNLKLRKIFVGGLHKSITNSKLYNLFRREGRIVGWKVFYDRNGYSRGFGVIEFDRPRDAWKTIQKWNNSDYMGYKLRIEYKKNFRRRINRNRRMNNTNNVTKGNYINNRSYFPKNNYQNGIRNVNSINYGNRSRYYYYRN